MALRLLSGSNDNGDVARALEDAGSGTLGARTDALQRRALVHVGVLHDEVGSAHTVVVLGVGHGGLENLLNVHSHGAVAEMQDIESLSHGLVADQVDHQASLAGGHANVLGRRADLAGRGVG